MRAINKPLLIEIIFNISHNYNCILSLVDLLHYTFHASPYPNLALTSFADSYIKSNFKHMLEHAFEAHGFSLKLVEFVAS
ncbi:hypothetical protein [Orientia tsutsugamushi]|uniref:hypothetical protein n=1 Tax=Orientia tsutsugamushi TaxID=784 RepID=UPI000D5A3C0F|nr:Uncharacterised protein [Orientia tsutsugamushi]